MIKKKLNIFFHGEFGLLQGSITFTQNQPIGIVFLSHSHPLYGGSMDDKILHILTKAFLEKNFIVVKHNSRGVGKSTGTFSNGIGESQDLQSIIRYVLQLKAITTVFSNRRPLIALAGFSFGSYVISLLLKKIEHDFSVLISSVPNKWQYPEIDQRTLIVHGEQDEICPLINVLKWLNSQSHPLTIIPRASHFFDEQQEQLKDTIRTYLLGICFLD